MLPIRRYGEKVHIILKNNVQNRGERLKMIEKCEESIFGMQYD